MDELVKAIAGKVGITESQAREAVNMVLTVLKENLPAPLSGQIEAALEGDLSGVDDVLGGLGGLFGKK